MNKENTKKLFSLYPELYAQHNQPMTHTCMCWGFECGNGWFDIINTLSHFITLHNKAKGTDVQAVQVKEKYGTLRFYVNYSDDFVDELIDWATSQSAQTCEECGEYGQINDGGWLSCRCEKCRSVE